MAGAGLRLTHLAALLGALAASVVGVTETQAASRACRQLEAQLAAASNGGGGKPGLIRKYDDAITRQRQQLAKARDRPAMPAAASRCFPATLANAPHSTPPSIA
ncbi:hypothetical protein AJ88_05475 [Mesorhizobium amorphae CCBAU 01583]|nr:hypothetical protein AJ88_05475 [Mesorhizobium amorphae CCBAU 01583]